MELLHGGTSLVSRHRCRVCFSDQHLEICRHCCQPVCPRCRAGDGAVNDGYTCITGCTLQMFATQYSTTMPKQKPDLATRIMRVDPHVWYIAWILVGVIAYIIFACIDPEVRP